MTFLKDLHDSRRKLADVLADEEYQGIREIVEELYPDKAHFIYELLQNAEDAGASEACFTLERGRLTFEHDGRPFTEQDVRGITNIGRGSKRNSDDQIGRFGVGFKAVFAYSETPRIWSPTFSFQIDDLVLPTALPGSAPESGQTRFEFPFNNPKKTARAAFQEIQAGLQALRETSLLFLSHLDCIRWAVADGPSGTVQRVQHSEHHIELITDSADATASRHYLKFDRAVEDLPVQRVAVAFELAFTADVDEFDVRVPLREQLKVVRARPGQVSVFFPAEKETSGLFFHLHAPFVPELSRASVKDTAANEPLFRQLAELSAAALHHVRDLGLLTTDFLTVLPNNNDDLPERYEAIRDAILDEMIDEALTPTYLKGHAPARCLLQARASLKELLGEDDLQVFHDAADEPREWATGINQKNSRLDRFLTSLEIKEWDLANFVGHLVAHASPEEGGAPHRARLLHGSSDRVIEWLGTKTSDWFQELYVTLEREYLPAAPWRRAPAAEGLSGLRIVRLTDGSVGSGATSFFMPGEAGELPEVPTVDPLTYQSGKNDADQASARRLLEAIGVRELGEVEQMEAYLAGHYTEENLEVNFDDMARFIEFAEDHPDDVGIFEGAFIFSVESDDPTTEYWCHAGQVVLCSPLLDTGLEEFHAADIAAGTKFILSSKYLALEEDLPRFLEFCEAVGVQSRLTIQQTSCHGNPRLRELVWGAPGGWSEGYGVNRDFQIPDLDRYLVSPNLSVAIARLIWRTMGDQPSRVHLEANYRNNSNHEVRRAPSALVTQLTEARWIPQGQGQFVRPAEAVAELLPEDFEVDPDSAWLKAIGFGQDASKNQAKHREQQRLARELGFSDEQTLRRAQAFSALSEEQQVKALETFQQRTQPAFPERSSGNAARRAERVAQDSTTAPGRLKQTRSRTVSVNLDEVKKRARAYLIDQYLEDGQMFCQACQAPMPFALPNGDPYFEAVELVRGLPAHHHQNYLALCPNHAAMFQHANDSREELHEGVSDMTSIYLDVVLARASTAVRFTEMHVGDLQAVLGTQENVTTG